MNTNPEELESFKSDINLTEYAAYVGYSLDRKKSSKCAATMTHANGDKIIIGKSSASGHWIYFSVRDDNDQGSIIDFVQKRDRLNMGEVRKTLRPWIGADPAPIKERSRLVYAAEIAPSTKDLIEVQANLASFEPAFSPYLYERGINETIQTSPRLVEKIYRDNRGNTIFPHQNLDGICGYEIKNKDFTGFAKGGEKGLWSSRLTPDDNAAVIAETAIDALSYFALWGHSSQRLFSLGGTMNPAQPDLVRRAIAKMPDRSRIIMAMDNDPAGERLAAAVQGAIGKEDLKRVEIVRHAPPEQGQDWNDVLQQSNIETSLEL